jgi:Ca-activated chloride channel family protein
VSLDEVTSELHPIDVVRNGSTRAVVSLRTGATLPNKDFILRYKTAGSQIETGLLTHVQKRGDGYFTLILQPPFAPPQQDVAPKEMVFVIDQTGSQSGWPIQKSKETMRLCLKRLNPEDTFQLIGFNTDVYPCFPGAVRATSANVTKALQYLDGVEAGGGTDILKSVDYALKCRTTHSVCASFAT